MLMKCGPCSPLFMRICLILLRSHIYSFCNRNVFQGNAYCLLVDRIPAYTGGCLPRGMCLPLVLGSVRLRGVCPGVSVEGVCPEGCLPLVLGVVASGPGGVCIPVCNGADISPCGQTDACENILTFANFVCER